MAHAPPCADVVAFRMIVAFSGSDGREECRPSDVAPSASVPAREPLSATDTRFLAALHQGPSCDPPDTTGAAG